MSVFNKSKLTNLRKRIEKTIQQSIQEEYDLEKCPYAQKILDSIADCLETIEECYDECCDDRDKELRKEKAEYLTEYRRTDVMCECGKEMYIANIYEHQKFACPLRHRPTKPTYDKLIVSRSDENSITLCMTTIEEYGKKTKAYMNFGADFLTRERCDEDWKELKELTKKVGRPLSSLVVFKKRMKAEYNLDLPSSIKLNP